MTVNEKAPVIAGPCQNISSEGEELTDMLRFGRVHARLLLDNIVEAQLQPLLFVKRAEFWRDGHVWIEERKHMTGADTTLFRQLREAANRDPDREYIRNWKCNAIC